MVDFDFVVERKVKLTSNTWELVLKTKQLPEIRAGQFANVKIPNRCDLLLRRPLCIYSVDKTASTIRIGFSIKGAGTQELSKVKVGETLQILLPLGNGFEPTIKKQKALIVGGGIGVLPLLSFAEENFGKLEMRACLGFRDNENVLKKDEFSKLCPTSITTDDGSFLGGEKGFVSALVETQLKTFAPEIVVACGPLPMLKGLKPFAQKNQIFVCLEERMGCGIGACLVCACATKKNENVSLKRVCVDGPVFRFEEVFYD